MLVAGGAGAVGNAAVQLAKWAGATVLATVSSAQKGDLARAAGADAVINYREEDVTSRVRELSDTGPHVVVEVSPGNLSQDMALIAPNGSIALYVPGEVTISEFQAYLKNVSLHFVLTYTTTGAQKDHAVAAVAEAVDAGAFRAGEQAGLPVLRFPLDRIAAAHEAVEQHVTGKVVVEVAAP